MVSLVSLNLLGSAISWACVCDNNYLCGPGDGRTALPFGDGGQQNAEDNPTRRDHLGVRVTGGGSVLGLEGVVVLHVARTIELRELEVFHRLDKAVFDVLVLE